MYLTEDFKIVTRWREQVNDPAIAIDMDAYSLSKISGLEKMDDLMRRAIVYYCYDQSHSTNFLYSMLAEVSHQLPRQKNEPLSSTISSYYRKVKHWFDTNIIQKAQKKQNTKPGEARATQILPQVDIYYYFNSRFYFTNDNTLKMDALCWYYVYSANEKHLLDTRSFDLLEEMNTEEGEKHIREMELDNSIYINEDTKINFIHNCGNFEEALIPKLCIYYDKYEKEPNNEIDAAYIHYNAGNIIMGEVSKDGDHVYARIVEDIKSKYAIPKNAIFIKCRKINLEK